MDFVSARYKVTLARYVKGSRQSVYLRFSKPVLAALSSHYGLTYGERLYFVAEPREHQVVAFALVRVDENHPGARVLERRGQLELPKAAFPLAWAGTLGGVFGLSPTEIKVWADGTIWVYNIAVEDQRPPRPND